MLCAFCPPTILGNFYRIPEKLPKSSADKRNRACETKDQSLKKIRTLHFPEQKLCKQSVKSIRLHKGLRCAFSRQQPDDASAQCPLLLSSTSPVVPFSCRRRQDAFPLASSDDQMFKHCVTTLQRQESAPW